MATHVLVTVRAGALLSATRPPARLSTLKKTLAGIRAIKSFDSDLGQHIYEITIDGEPWIVVDNSAITEHPSA